MENEVLDAINDLHEGIDIGKKISTSLHNFELKLLAIDMAIQHIMFDDRFQENKGMQEFVELMFEMVSGLRDKLASLEKGDIHIVLEEEAALARGSQWVMKHRKIVEGDIKEEIKVDKEVIILIHKSMKDFNTEFVQAEEHFKGKEVKFIFMKLFQFFSAYEKIFEDYLKQLKKLD